MRMHKRKVWKYRFVFRFLLFNYDKESRVQSALRAQRRKRKYDNVKVAGNFLEKCKFYTFLASFSFLTQYLDLKIILHHI